MFVLFLYNKIMFKRPIDLINRVLVNKQYKKLVNADNIANITSHELNRIFFDEDESVVDTYLHNVIDEWWSKQEEDEQSFKKLKSIIKKTKIKLNQVDIHNIFLIEERVFSTDRHIKILDVNENLLDKEVVGAKFVDGRVYIRREQLVPYRDGDLLFSNKRIIVISKTERLSFFWEAITKIEFKEFGFTIHFKGKEYVFRIHDQITLNNTLKNFLNKKVRKWKNI